MLFKIKSLTIFFLCVLKFFSLGRANEKIENSKKVIIIQMAKLGDMVCTTPMFFAIKKTYPQCNVYVCGNRINKNLLEGNKDVDEYIIFEGFWGAVRKIKSEKIDFGCITSPDFVGLAVLYLAGIPLISAPDVKNGFSPYETWQYKILRKFVVAKPHRMGAYAPREYLRLLEPIDIFTDDTKKHLAFSKGAEEKIKDFFVRNNLNDNKDLIVGISPSAGNKIKQWAPERFAELANYISGKHNGKILIVGGPNDNKEVDEMIKFMNKDALFLNTQGLFNLDELKALISRLSVFISVDTGPIYIAEAFGVPTIDIVGPIDEREQPPIGKVHRVVRIENREKPELHVMNARCYNYKEARRQVDEISVEMAEREFDDLVSRLNTI